MDKEHLKNLYAQLDLFKSQRNKILESFTKAAYKYWIYERLDVRQKIFMPRRVMPDLKNFPDLPAIHDNITILENQIREIEDADDKYKRNLVAVMKFHDDEKRKRLKANQKIIDFFNKRSENSVDLKIDDTNDGHYLIKCVSKNNWGLTLFKVEPFFQRSLRTVIGSVPSFE